MFSPPPYSTKYSSHVTVLCLLLTGSMFSLSVLNSSAVVSFTSITSRSNNKSYSWIKSASLGAVPRQPALLSSSPLPSPSRFHFHDHKSAQKKGHLKTEAHWHICHSWPCSDGLQLQAVDAHCLGPLRLGLAFTTYQGHKRWVEVQRRGTYAALQFIRLSTVRLAQTLAFHYYGGQDFRGTSFSTVCGTP